jgi:hypothetical protein
MTLMPRSRFHISAGRAGDRHRHGGDRRGVPAGVAWWHRPSKTRLGPLHAGAVRRMLTGGQTLKKEIRFEIRWDPPSLKGDPDFGCASALARRELQGMSIDHSAPLM